jgi:hypothetical protein
MIGSGSFNLFIARIKLGKVTESKAFEMSNEASHVSFPRFLEVLRIEVVIERGSIVLWSLRPAKLELERMCCDLRIKESLLFKILVKIFLDDSIRDIGLVSVKR